MEAFSTDERGESSVVSVVLMLAVAVLLASTVAVFVFGVGTSDIKEAANDILDMDDDMYGVVPFAATSSRLGQSRDSTTESRDSTTKLDNSTAESRGATAESRDEESATRPPN